LDITCFYHQAFISDFNVLISVAIIAAVISFLLAYLLEIASKALRVKHETIVSIILMGTSRNWSMAGVAIKLFTERSTIPPSVYVFFAVFMIVWLGYHFRK
jgi:ACR3 family arsenite efflux pump ArsB